MKEHYIHLLKYHQWANLRLLEHTNSLSENIFLKRMESVFPTIADTFFHIYNANRIWLKRCNPSLNLNEDIIEFKDAAAAKESFEELQKIMLEYFNDYYNELDEIVYQNSKGTVFKNSMNEIIYHVVNHGTYHRGNIAAMVRQLGLKGISTDYIQFLRDMEK